jgi:RNA recognition motif-containing protein
MSMTLFVGNLNYEVEVEDLQKHFDGYGPIASVKIPLDRETNRKRGFGFVEFADYAKAEAAMNALNGSELFGRTINVNEARPMEKRQGGGQGGRQGSGGGGQRRNYTR